jgi:hypothetical protein
MFCSLCFAVAAADVKDEDVFGFCKAEYLNRLLFAFSIWWPIMDMTGYYHGISNVRWHLCMCIDIN